MLFVAKCVVIMATVARATQPWSFEAVQPANVIYTDSLLFEDEAVSRTDCARLCMEQSGCLTFTFTSKVEGSLGQGKCRGHSQNMTQSSSVAGTESFQLVVEAATVTCPPCSTTFDADTFSSGWRVIQRRCHGCEDFDRPWSDYQAGFGNPDGEFWLGLEQMHQETSGQAMKLSFDLELWNGTTAFATYSNFTVGPESDNYRLDFGSQISGDAADGVISNRGQAFSTWDADNDPRGNMNCAMTFRGGWWYKACSKSFPNMLYSQSAECPASSESPNHCLSWLDFGQHANNSLKTVQMKIKVMTP